MIDMEERMRCGRCHRAMGYGRTWFGVGDPGMMNTLMVCGGCGAEAVVTGPIDITDPVKGGPIAIDLVGPDGEWYVSVDPFPDRFDGAFGHGRCLSLLYVGNAESASYYGRFEDGTVVEDMLNPEQVYGYPSDIPDDMRAIVLGML